MTSFVICTIAKYYSGDKVEEDVMAGIREKRNACRGLVEKL
jgi:hypothetical protein